MSEPTTLRDIVASPGYCDRVSYAAERIASALDAAAVQRLLIDGVAVLGAQNAFFVSFERGSTEIATCRFMLACEPEGCRPNLEADKLLQDPWLAYAARHAAPIVASVLPVAARGGHELIAPSHRHGFASTLLVPAHSGPGHSRIGLLALGCPQAGFFEDEGLPRFRCGHSSKLIARELDVSPCAIDSRFQRINARLGVPTRRAAVRLAVECGLLVG
jgi:hypothetical protein